MVNEVYSKTGSSGPAETTGRSAEEDTIAWIGNKPYRAMMRFCGNFRPRGNHDIFWPQANGGQPFCPRQIQIVMGEDGEYWQEEENKPDKAIIQQVAAEPKTEGGGYNLAESGNEANLTADYFLMWGSRTSLGLSHLLPHQIC